MLRYSGREKVNGAGGIRIPPEMRRDMELEAGDCVRLSLDAEHACVRLEKAPIVRRGKLYAIVDEHGRIQLPAFLLEALQVKEHTAMLITCDHAKVSVSLRAQTPYCCACGRPDGLHPFGKVFVCEECRRELVSSTFKS